MTLNANDIGLRGNDKSPARVIVQLLHEYREVAYPGPDHDMGLANERLRAIQLAGATAAMFGGLAAQQRLFAQVEKIDLAAAGMLSNMWDLVGEWLS